MYQAENCPGCLIMSRQHKQEDRYKVKAMVIYKFSNINDFKGFLVSMSVTIAH